MPRVFKKAVKAPAAYCCIGTFLLRHEANPTLGPKAVRRIMGVALGPPLGGVTGKLMALV